MIDLVDGTSSSEPYHRIAYRFGEWLQRLSNVMQDYGDGRSRRLDMPQYEIEELFNAVSYQAYADMLGYSRSHLSVKIRNAVGTKGCNIFRGGKAGLAKRLLVETSMSIGEIAKQCTERDASAFSKRFRNWTGMSPTQYRRMHR
jgi:AraC-like DNA-binding protein